MNRSTIFNQHKKITMKKFRMNRSRAVSKTKWVSYLLAILMAIQPLLDLEVDISNKQALVKYVIRLLAASAVALLGKYTATRSVPNEMERR
jgi:hypothetical protein